MGGGARYLRRLLNREPRSEFSGKDGMTALRTMRARVLAISGLLVFALGSLVSSCAGGSAGLSPPSLRPVPPTDAPIREGTDLVKTAGSVVAVDGDRIWLRIVDRNQGTQRIWNNMTVAAIVTPRTVFPGLGVKRLADARLTFGQEVTFTFIPTEYDDQVAAYPALVIGREQRTLSP